MKGSPPQHPTRPSYTGVRVEIAHSCDMLSALRFVMPAEKMQLLNVEGAPEPANPHIVSDGGGIARAPACGAEPSRDGFEHIFGEQI